MTFSKNYISPLGSTQPNRQDKPSFSFAPQRTCTKCHKRKLIAGGRHGQSGKGFTCKSCCELEKAEKS